MCGRFWLQANVLLMPFLATGWAAALFASCRLAALAGVSAAARHAAMAAAAAAVVIAQVRIRMPYVGLGGLRFVAGRRAG